MKKVYSLLATLALCASLQAETINLTAQLSASTVMYQAGMGGWSMEFLDDTESYYICTLIESADFTGDSMDELVGTYTIDNLSPYLSFITTPDFSLWVEFVDANITVTGDETNGYQFDMQINGSDGNDYVIDAHFGSLTIIDEKDVDFGQVTMLKHYEDGGDWYIKMANEEYALNLDILTEELDGTYAAKDFDPLFTFADDLVNNVNYLYVVQAEVTINTVDDVTTIGGWVVLEDGVKLNIHAVYGEQIPVGIQNVSEVAAASRKSLINGSIRIQNGKSNYNVNGVTIK